MPFMVRRERYHRARMPKLREMHTLWNGRIRYMTDYTEEQKAKLKERDTHENTLRDKAEAERAAYLAIGNRKERRRRKALGL